MIVVQKSTSPRIEPQPVPHDEEEFFPLLNRTTTTTSSHDNRHHQPQWPQPLELLHKLATVVLDVFLLDIIESTDHLTRQAVVDEDTGRRSVATESDGE